MGEQVKDKQWKIPVSFKKKNEGALYEWVLNKRNYSVYIKDLIEADMEGRVIWNSMPQEPPKEPVQEDVKEQVEEPVEDAALELDPMELIMGGVPE